MSETKPDVEKDKENITQIFETKLNKEQQEINTEVNSFFQEMFSDKEALRESLKIYLPYEAPETLQIILDFLLEIAPKVKIEALSPEETMAYFQDYTDIHLEQVHELYAQNNIVTIPALFAFSKNVWGTGQGFAHDEISKLNPISGTYEPTRQQYFSTPKVSIFMSKIGLSRAISIFIEMYFAYCIDSAAKKLSSNTQRPMDYIAMEHPLDNTPKQNLDATQSLLKLAQNTRAIDALYEVRNGKLLTGEAFVLERGRVNPILRLLSENIFKDIHRLRLNLVPAKEFPQVLQRALERFAKMREEQ